jgi:hypothetical protein
MLLQRSSSLLEASETTGHALTDTIACSRAPAIPDTTAPYYGNHLPTVRAGRGDGHQHPSCAEAVGIRETLHELTSARSHMTNA